ncbi:MAG TPA: GTP 3',8-cyclase MoaA [Fimbriimonadales bacterium]|jgi:cyclic pyranopterin phosphate synthase|nr:GTP 3',8-cyclase MoaA [Fimbriimonadales bacterium]
MRDSFGRTIDYLRVSVTDRCNFRCVYCMPADGYPVSPKDELLTFEEIARIVRIASDLGITKVRLTGGEPLVRKDLPSLVGMIRANSGLRDISCTTNGFLLREMAKDLRAAGLDRANISLDTLDPEKFQRIARRGSLAKVLDGIDAAKEAGLSPIKINCVLMAGVNSDEAADFAAWTLRDEVHVRFIELMPIRWNMDDAEGFDGMSALAGADGLFRLRRSEGGMLDDADMRRMMVPSDKIKRDLEARFGPVSDFDLPTNGPARTYKLPGAKGTLGFISQISADLCSRCNRLRLTADGQLRPCLMSDGEVDLREAMRGGASDGEIADRILKVVAHKPERHYLAEGQKVAGRTMNQIGG